MMNDNASVQEDGLHCHCPCGKSKFTVKGAPVVRFKCHCSICQTVYQKPFADFNIVKAESIEIAKLNGIQYKRHKAPPAVERGTCPSCKRPAIRWFKMIPGLPLAMIPSENFPESTVLPEPMAHIFYDSRQTDVDDDVPKVSGYLCSEWQVFRHVFKRLR